MLAGVFRHALLRGKVEASVGGIPFDIKIAHIKIRVGLLLNRNCAGQRSNLGSRDATNRRLCADAQLAISRCTHRRNFVSRPNEWIMLHCVYYFRLKPFG